MIKAQRVITANKAEYISSLESQLQDSKNKVAELEAILFYRVEWKKGKELAEKDEINKQLTRIKVENLHEEVNMKQEEVTSAYQRYTQLREDLKVKEDELNTANLKIQKLQTKSKP